MKAYVDSYGKILAIIDDEDEDQDILNDDGNGGYDNDINGGFI